MALIENILNEAMNLRPSDRALLAQQLINSLSQGDDDTEQAWLDLSEKRLNELKSGVVKPLSWKEIRKSVTKG